MGNNGTLRQRRLGRELRRLREDAGLSLEDAAPQLDWSTSRLSRIETGSQGIDVHGVRSMLDLYDVGGERWTEIIDLTRAARQKGWWHAYGLNNAGYLVLEADAAVGARVPTRPRARVAADRRTVLRRLVGGVEVMREQLRHLVRQAALPSVCLQVVPASVGTHEGLSGSFNVLEFVEPDEPGIVYLESAVNAVHVHKETEVRGYTLVFDRLRSAALSPPDSMTLVERLADDL